MKIFEKIKGFFGKSKTPNYTIIYPPMLMLEYDLMPEYNMFINEYGNAIMRKNDNDEIHPQLLPQNIIDDFKLYEHYQVLNEYKFIRTNFVMGY